MDLLESQFPKWEFDAEWLTPALRGLTEPVITEPTGYGEILLSMLARPNICSRNWIARQYDHEVQGGSVIKPLVGKNRDVPGDAAVVRPVLSSRRGIAVSQALSPHYSAIDTYNMAANAIDEAVRKVIAVGGDPRHLGGVDNFCWPTIQFDAALNPDGKYKAAQLVRANWALRDYCLEYGIPLLSGKDSMYIDGNLAGPYGERRRVSGLPTLLFTVCSVIEDIGGCVSMDAKCAGDLVYILGETHDELGGSEYYQMLGYTGANVPAVDAKRSLRVYELMSAAIRKGLLASCHAVSRGGLAVHLALVAMAGEIGMDLDIGLIPAKTDLSTSRRLFSESAGRFIITVSEENRNSFEAAFSAAPAALIGRCVTTDNLTVRSGDEIVMSEDIMALKERWKAPFGGLV
jgi:phosphoribosylformylglycinamidine synthase